MNTDEYQNLKKLKEKEALLLSGGDGRNFEHI
jgi:hypothetical protein